jgi:hypothetical protein
MTNVCDGLADQLVGLVAENAADARCDVEESSFEREDVDEVGAGFE